MSVGGIHKIVLQTTLVFAAAMLMMWSCKKRDPFTGCVASFKGLQCKVGDVTMVADSSGADYDTVRRRLRIFAKDDQRGFKVMITVNAPLQNFDLKMSNNEAFGTGKCTFLKDGAVFISKYGNIGINIDGSQSLKTLCGQFFMQDDGNFTVSQGEFKSLPIRYTNF
jgi:hypothetical protein